MSLRHTVCFRFVEGTTADQATELKTALETLPDAIPEIVDYRCGPDLGINPDSWDFVVTADFASRADYETYRDHPVHQELIRTMVRPLLADRASAQIEMRPRCAVSGDVGGVSGRVGGVPRKECDEARVGSW